MVVTDTHSSFPSLHYTAQDKYARIGQLCALLFPDSKVHSSDLYFLTHTGHAYGTVAYA